MHVMRHIFISVAVILILLVYVMGCSDSGKSSYDDITPKLTWFPVETTVDDMPLPIAGYKIYYGTSSGIYTNVVDVGNTTYRWFSKIPGLTTDTTYYFAVTSYLDNGDESDFSNEFSGKITRISY